MSHTLIITLFLYQPKFGETNFTHWNVKGIFTTLMPNGKYFIASVINLVAEIKVTINSHIELHTISKVTTHYIALFIVEKDVSVL
jgi:uncharacterized membrane protein